MKVYIAVFRQICFFRIISRVNLNVCTVQREMHVADLVSRSESRVSLSEVLFRTDGSRRWRTDFIRPREVAEPSFGRLRHGASPGNAV